MTRRSWTLLWLVLMGALSGCKTKCSDAPIDAAFERLDSATKQALTRVKSAKGVKMCAASESAHEPAAMVFSGTTASAWRTIEDSLIAAGWVRTSQTEHPKADDTLFQVFYGKPGRLREDHAPRLHLMLYSHASCKFGDVCVRAKLYGKP